MPKRILFWETTFLLFEQTDTSFCSGRQEHTKRQRTFGKSVACPHTCLLHLAGRPYNNSSPVDIRKDTRILSAPCGDNSGTSDQSEKSSMFAFLHPRMKMYETLHLLGFLQKRTDNTYHAARTKCSHHVASLVDHAKESIRPSDGSHLIP